MRRTGKRVSAGALWCVGRPDGGDHPPRVAFAIGKPVGNAVTRNRLRRRLRVVLAAHADRFPSGDYLVGVRPPVDDLSFDDLRTMIDLLLLRSVERW